MRRALFALALLTTVTGLARAQDEKPSVLVYPFGMTSAARATGGDAAGILAARALEGVLATDRFAPIDESANPAIKHQLESAMTLSQFESAVQLKTDRQLQSKYMLTGFIQSAEAKPADGRGNERIYQASVTAILKLYDVETRAVIVTRELTLSNGLVSGAKVQDCSGLRGRMRCAAMKAAGGAVDEGLNKKVGGTAGDALKASSPQEAIDAALRSAPSEIAKLLNEAIK